MLIATMLGIAEKDVMPGARWVNTGSEQLIIPMANAQAVASAKPKADLFSAVASDIGRSMAYVFAPNGEEQGKAKLLSRFFFLQHGAIVDDPGTGSATANLGGWLAGGDHTLPVEVAIGQIASAWLHCCISPRVD